MNSLIALNDTIQILKFNAPRVLSLLGVLWLVHLVNWAMRYRLNILGIYPRRIPGLMGIAASPLLHASATHLFMNSIPFFILGSFVMMYGVPVFWVVTVMIAVLSGFAVWLFGRPALHIGASGVIMGYFGFLLATAYHTHSFIAVLSAIVCLIYLGSMLIGIVPQKGRASWEAHLFGFIAGIVASFTAGYFL